MRLLIVNLHFDIGGVETLLTRLIPHFKNAGVDVTILLIRRKYNLELLSKLNGLCTIRFLDELFPYTKKKIIYEIGAKYDVVFCTISYGLLVAGWLVNRAGLNSPKFVPAVYQTLIYCEDSNAYHWRLTRHVVANEVSPESMIFANNACRNIHAEKLGVNYSLSPVVRLLVDVEKYNFKYRQYIPRIKIVSIGKIISFKTYNFTMLEVVSTLLREGYDVVWHIYGDGPQFAELSSCIKRYKLQANVLLHGALAYSNFQSVLEDAFLFVGSGTSLIEAAACGVPSLTTIEYSESPISYGFISEIPGFDMIEPGLDIPKYLLLDKIRSLIECDENCYKRMQDDCLQKAKQYSGESVIDQYMKVFSGSILSGTCVSISSAQMVRVFISFVISRIQRAILDKVSKFFQ